MPTELQRVIKKYVPREVALVFALMMAKCFVEAYENVLKEAKRPPVKKKTLKQSKAKSDQMRCKSCNQVVKCQTHERAKIEEISDEDYGYSYICLSCVDEGATIAAIMHCCDAIRTIKGIAKELGCTIETRPDAGYGFFTNGYQAKLIKAQR